MREDLKMAKAFELTRTGAWALWGLAIFFVVKIYFPTLHTGFFFDDWGDLGNVAESTFLQRLKDFSPLVDNWRAMAYMSWFLEYKLFGFNSVGYHATHLFLHVINCTLVFILAQRLSGRWSLAFLAGFLMMFSKALIHPVAWNSASIDQRLVLFFIPSLLAWMKMRDSEGWKKIFFLVVSVIFYYLTLKSKLMAVTVIALYPLFELVFYPPPMNRAAFGSWVRKMSLNLALPLLLLGLYSYAHYVMPREGEYGVTLTLPHYLTSLLWYLDRITGAVFHESGGGILPALFLVLLCGVYRSPVALFGTLWFALTLIPVAVLTTHHFDHHLYLPFVGLALAFGDLILRLFNSLNEFFRGRELLRQKNLSTVLLWTFFFIALIKYGSFLEGHVNEYAQTMKGLWTLSNNTLSDLKKWVPSPTEESGVFLVYPRPAVAVLDYNFTLQMVYPERKDLSVQVFDELSSFEKEVNSRSEGKKNFWAFLYDPKTGKLQPYTKGAHLSRGEL